MDSTDNQWLGWLTLASVPITALVVTALNLWANARVRDERDKVHTAAFNRVEVSLSNFGERLGAMHTEVVEMRTGLGIGKDHGLYAEVREMRRSVDEVGNKQTELALRAELTERRLTTLERGIRDA
jgi:hypothetical protein